MNPLVKVAGFVVGLAVVFGAAVGLGRLFDPIADASAAAAEHDDTTDGAEHGAADGHSTEAQATSTTGTEEIPGGLMVSQAGYTFRLHDPLTSPGPAVPVSFTIEGPDGPLTSYDVEHETQLHLIAVRRDFTGFQHVHPVLAADGTWSTRLALTPGESRATIDRLRRRPSRGRPRSTATRWPWPEL